MPAEYNLWIVTLSFFVGVLASFLALEMATRVATATSDRPAGRFGLPIAAVAMGTGIWSMHFVGMLALRLPVPVSYSLSVTFLSLAFAIGASYVALRVVQAERLSAWRLAAGGLLMGGGIALMHYTGMVALQILPRPDYDPMLWTLSVVIAVAAASAALWICFHLKSGNGRLWTRVGSALVMGLAIWGMHFTGMAAVRFAPDTYCIGNPLTIDNSWLAGTIAFCVLVMLMSLPMMAAANAWLTRRHDGIPIRRWSRVAYRVNGALLALLVTLTVMVFLTEDIPIEAAERQRQAHAITDELAQSEEDLLRTVRMYAQTSDPAFERMYMQILAIRNGSAPRPLEYDPSFWFQAASDARLKPPPEASAESLIGRLQKTGLTAKELMLLGQSELAMQATQSRELVAMDAVKGRFHAADGSITEGVPDPELAQRLLFDAPYLKAKTEAMRPLAELQRSVDARNQQVSRNADRRIDLYISLMLIALATLLTSMGLTFLATRHKVSSLLLLEEKTRRFGEPGFEFADTDGADEISQLGRTFAAMHRKVIERTAALEHEISERKRAEDESERFFNQSLNLLMVAGFDGSYRRLNPAWEQALGFTREYLLARGFMEFVHVDDRASVADAVKRVQRDGSAMAVECRCRCADGSYKTYSWNAAQRGDGESFYATGHDVSTLRETERELRTSEMQLNTIVENLAEGVIVSGMDGQLLHINRAAVIMHGFSDANEGLMHLSELHRLFEVTTLEGDICTLDEWPLSRSLRGETTDNAEFQVRRTDLDNWCRVLSYSSSLVPDSDGRPQMAVLTVSDITERTRAEAERHQAQKLESVGRLAAGIAHEINSPLQFINDCSNFVRDGVTELGTLVAGYRQTMGALADGSISVDAALKETSQREQSADLDYLIENIPGAIDRSLEGLQRVTEIVRSMKEFSHPDQKNKVHADLNQAIQSTLTIAQHEYRYVADVITEFEPLPLVPCYLGDLNQAVLNLVVNAAHAIEDVVRGSGRKGVIRVCTRVEGDQAVISIEDSGGGIPEAIRSKIFDPFFTTKGIGKGTGQGLALARAVVVDMHKGRLEFDTWPGKGTRFIIRLPLMSAAETAQAR